MSLLGHGRATCLLPSQWLTLILGLWTVCGGASQLSAQVVNADGTGANGGAVAQASYTSSGSYFNRELGTPLRFSYQSEGYGTELGVVSLGTMKVFNLDGATWFLDGQGTMSDDFGGGFNFGAGYRELNNMSHGFDPDRILGGSFWVDGQSTKADNFFTQLGFALESLGESFDLRMNGYFPLDRTQSSDPTLIDIDTVTFSENRLFAGLEQFTTDTAFSVIDAEAAKRIHDLDAWATAGVYYLGGGGADDTGYRLGVRGYAVPDLLVGVQVTDDDVYHTNVMATLTWFVGRTHKGNAPIGAIVDRFREPVMRNSFIATTSAQTIQGAGGPLTDADNNELFNFIHVNSSAAGGGDGTFENPYNNLAEAEAAQADGAYVYVHGGSVLAANDPFTLLDNVKFWGEGTNEFGDVVLHVVDSVERGTVTLPETSTGARDLDSPTINVAAGQEFLQLADNNDINNFEINGGTNAVIGNGVNAPQLANLDINTPTGTGISLTNTTGTTVVDNTVTITNAGTGMLIDGGSAGMNINARITNSNGSSLIVDNRTGGTIAFGGSILDTDGTVDINGDTIVDADDADVDTADAIVIQGSTGTNVINFTQTLDLGEDMLGINVDAGDFRSLFIDDNVQTTTITFADLRATSADANTVEMQDGGTLTINDSDDDSLIANTGTGDAFNNVGNPGATFDSTITVNANIENSGGGNAVDISGRDANNVTFNGEITDTNSEGISLFGNSGGTIAFNDQVTTTTTGTGKGVSITGGSDATYAFTDIDITTNSGIGFEMTGGGILTVVPSANEMNTITTTSGQALVLDGTSASPGDALSIGEADVNFATINVTAGTADAVVVREVDGPGQVILGSGDDPGDGGSITTVGAASGIVIDNAADIAVNNINVNKSGTGQAVSITNQGTDDVVAFSGVEITSTGAANGLVVGSTTVPADGNEDGAMATFNELVVNSEDGNAVTVQSNTGGEYIFTDLTAATSGTGDAVHIQGNTADTLVSFNDMDLDATGSGDAFSSENAALLVASGENTLDAVSGRGVFIDGATIDDADATFGIVNVTNATVSAANLTGNGVVIRNTGGTGLLTVGSGTTAGAGGIITSEGDAILIDNADDVEIIRMTVANGATTGNGLVIQNQDGGDVLVTGLTTTTSSGAGIVADSNTGGTNIFNTSDVNASGAGDGVRLTNNTGATNSFNTIDIDAAGGTGFTASGGGTVIATGNNTVNTTTGTAVELNGITSGAGNIAFNSVNTVGAANGVIVNNVTGGSVSIGSTGTVSSLNTTGDAIRVENSALVNVTNVDVTGTGGNGLVATHSNGVGYTLNVNDLTVADTKVGGIVSTHSGAGAFVLNVDNSTINAASDLDHTGSGSYTVDINNSDFTETVDIDASGTGIVDITAGGTSTFVTAGGDVAFAITLGNPVTLANIRVTNSTISAEQAVAFDFNSNSTNSKTVNFLFNNNTVTNNDDTFASAEYDANGATILNATVTNSTFNNAGAGLEFDMAANSGNTVVNLNLNNNTADGGAGTFMLRELNGSDFNIQDRDTVETRNTGNFSYDSPGDVLTDFDNITSVPTPP